MSGFAAYVQAACHCRLGWQCGFCRRQLGAQRLKHAKTYRCCTGCDARLFRRESMLSGLCWECRLCEGMTKNHQKGKP
jgi:hypothetical protein